MITWRLLVGNAMWILALAAILACVSFVSWQAAQSAGGFRQRLQRPAVQAVLSLFAVIFCAGLALLTKSPLALVVWLILGGLFLVNAVLALRQTNQFH